MAANFDHGRHWYFLAIDGQPQAKLRNILAELAAGESLIVEHQKFLQLIDDGDLRCSFLLRDGQFIAAYPLVVDGFGWPLKIHDTITWPDGLQANLVVSCEGQRFALFDTQHFLHRESYDGGQERTFVVAALAYKLFDTVYESAQQQAQLAGQKAFFPLRPEDGCLDEIKFMSHVEAVREVNMRGVPLRAYTLTLAEAEDFPMRLDVFAHPDVCERDFQPGDAISGFAWLFGAARAT